MFTNLQLGLKSPGPMAQYLTWCLSYQHIPTHLHLITQGGPRGIQRSRTSTCHLDASLHMPRAASTVALGFPYAPSPWVSQVHWPSGPVPLKEGGPTQDIPPGLPKRQTLHTPSPLHALRHLPLHPPSHCQGVTFQDYTFELESVFLSLACRDNTQRMHPGSLAEDAPRPSRLDPCLPLRLGLGDVSVPGNVGATGAEARGRPMPLGLGACCPHSPQPVPSAGLVAHPPHPGGPRRRASALLLCPLRSQHAPGAA